MFRNGKNHEIVSGGEKNLKRFRLPFAPRNNDGSRSLSVAQKASKQVVKFFNDPTKYFDSASNVNLTILSSYHRSE